MISIIICSVHPQTDATLIKNIQKTIGTGYEIVHIDNSEGKYGICSAYNEGVRRSKGDILCFMHEDILFHSHNWGKVVEQHFESPMAGMLGVAGAVAVSNKYDWRFFGFSKSRVIQGFKILSYPMHYFVKGIEWDISSPKERVAIVDGCWFCIRRKLFDEDLLKFDEKTFQGFHLYDSDISMQVNKSNYYIYLCSDIVIEHFSEGIYTLDFKKNLYSFFQKWYKELPFSVKEISPNLWEKAERKAKGELEKRIDRDQKIIQITQFYEHYQKSGDTPILPLDAMQIVEESAYQYVRFTIKSSAKSIDAWNALTLYRKMQYKPRMVKLFMKFLYYRLINRKCIVYTNAVYNRQN